MKMLFFLGGFIISVNAMSQQYENLRSHMKSGIKELDLTDPNTPGIINIFINAWGANLTEQERDQLKKDFLTQEQIATLAAQNQTPQSKDKALQSLNLACDTIAALSRRLQDN